MFNEFTTLFLTYILMTFSVANPQKPDRDYDYAFLSLAGGNLAVHLFILTRASYKSVKKSIKKCIKKKKPKKVKT